MTENTSPLPVRIAQILFLVMAATWTVLGVFSMARLSGSFSALIVAVLMFGNAAILAWLSSGIAKQNRTFFYLGLAYLLLNILLTFTDQFGLLDLLTVAVDIFLAGLLLVNRTLWLSSR
jgi:hypothetical protein